MGDRPNARPSTPFSRKLVRHILGFGVGVAVGLAPYLGALKVPLFTPLLSLYPDSLRDTMLPLSAAAMGVMVVVMQWYAGENPPGAWVRRVFMTTLAVTVFGFITLIIVQTFFVIVISAAGGTESYSFVVGWSRLPQCPCQPQWSDSECIKNLLLDNAAIAGCWGDRNVAIGKLLLLFSYLIFTIGFGALVGWLLIRRPNVADAPALDPE